MAGPSQAGQAPTSPPHPHHVTPRPGRGRTCTVSCGAGALAFTRMRRQPVPECRTTEKCLSAWPGPRAAWPLIIESASMSSSWGRNGPEGGVIRTGGHGARHSGTETSTRERRGLWLCSHSGYREHRGADLSSRARLLQGRGAPLSPGPAPACPGPPKQEAGPEAEVSVPSSSAANQKGAALAPPPALRIGRRFRKGLESRLGAPAVGPPVWSLDDKALSPALSWPVTVSALP